MSRTEANCRFTPPMAYKSIDAVIEAQGDLVDVVLGTKDRFVS